MRAAASYPAVLDLGGLEALVLGGGAVALRKLRGLPEGMKRIRVVAPKFSAALRIWARRHTEVQLLSRVFRPTDLVGCRLLFCCSNDAEANAVAARRARRTGAWVCQAQDPAQGNLSVPARARAGGLLLTVSTGGASPALAKALRVHFEDQLKASDLPWLLGQLRRRRAGIKSASDHKTRLIRRLADPKVVAVALGPRTARGRRRLEALFRD
ncbi:MAG: precorrin-2 dehydrogenase/sirohydrochlorin ferrochelatase family protein [bacterium]